MRITRKITDTISMIGASDRNLKKFENLFDLPNGMAYNAYILKDEKVVVFDTIDAVLSDLYFENLEYEASGRDVDYIVVHHMESDHCHNIKKLADRYPNMKIVCSAKAATMVSQFFGPTLDERIIKVGQDDELDLGNRKLKFIAAPMVHWPEVLYSYDDKEKVLFTSDAFGAFGALDGNILLSEVALSEFLISEYRRYYANICGRFGIQVGNSLKKVSGLDIKYVCPLHGRVIDANFDVLLDKYTKWASYTPEDDNVLIIYGSMHGNTEMAAYILANELGALGCKDIKLYNASDTDISYLVSETFRCRNIVFVSPTYNNSVYLPMRTLLDDLKHLNFQNRNVALMENGSWSCGACKMMGEMLDGCKNLTFIGEPVKILSTVTEDSYNDIKKLADEISKVAK